MEKNNFYFESPTTIDKITNYSELSSEEKNLIIEYVIIQISKRNEDYQFLVENKKTEICEEKIKNYKKNLIYIKNKNKEKEKKKIFEYKISKNEKNLKMSCFSKNGKNLYNSEMDLEIVKNIIENKKNLEKKKILQKYHENPKKQINQKFEKKVIKKYPKGVPFEILSLHNKIDDAWISIERKVYDITNYIKKHPGGKIIEEYLGQEATNDFMKYHHWVSHSFILKDNFVGILKLI